MAAANPRERRAWRSVGEGRVIAANLRCAGTTRTVLAEHGNLLIGYVIPLAFLAVSTLFIQGRIPPNRFIGFRTEDTLSDPEIWYPVNRAMGWFLAPAAALSLAFNLSLEWIFPDWPQGRIASWTTGGTLIPLVIALVLSIRHYLRPPSV